MEHSINIAPARVKQNRAGVRRRRVLVRVSPDVGRSARRQDRQDLRIGRVVTVMSESSGNNRLQLLL